MSRIANTMWDFFWALIYRQPRKTLAYILILNMIAYTYAAVVARTSTSIDYLVNDVGIPLALILGVQTILIVALLRSRNPRIYIIGGIFPFIYVFGQLSGVLSPDSPIFGSTGVVFGMIGNIGISFLSLVSMRQQVALDNAVLTEYRTVDMLQLIQACHQIVGKDDNCLSARDKLKLAESVRRVQDNMDTR